MSVSLVLAYLNGNDSTNLKQGDMKKIITFRALLIVMAAMIGCMANAQLLNSNKTGKVYSAVQRPAMMQVKKDAPVKEPIQMHNKMVKKKLHILNLKMFYQELIEKLKLKTF